MVGKVTVHVPKAIPKNEIRAATAAKVAAKKAAKQKKILERGIRSTANKDNVVRGKVTKK